MTLNHRTNLVRPTCGRLAPKKLPKPGPECSQLANLQRRGFFATIAEGAVRLRFVTSWIEWFQESLRRLDAQVRGLHERRRKNLLLSLLFQFSSFAFDVIQVSTLGLRRRVAGELELESVSRRRT